MGERYFTPPAHSTIHAISYPKQQNSVLHQRSMVLALLVEISRVYTIHYASESLSHFHNNQGINNDIISSVRSMRIDI
jgi:hypothetical protein